MKKFVLTLILLGFVFLFTSDITKGSNVNNSDKTFIYLYLDNCKYCKDFDKNYKKLEKKYNKVCQFSKVPIMSKEGMAISYSFGINSAPFVLIFDNKTNKVTTIDQRCIMNYSCLEDNFTSIIK